MNKEHVIEIIEQILTHLHVSVDQIVAEDDEKTESTRYKIVTPDSAILIGERGVRLSSLNHIVKKIMEHRFPDQTMNFSIDVNDYQKKHIDELRQKAHILAERARYFKSTVDMEPMSAYERMIIHSEFADIPDIETISSGVGKDRKISLKYVESKNP